MELKQIDQRIRAIKNSASKLAASIQEVGVAIIQHAAEHGDTTRALALVKAVGAGVNQRKLIFWFDYFGNIAMDVNADKVRLHKQGSKAFRPFDVDGAKANPWNTFVDPRQPPEQLPVTLGEFIGENIKIFDRLSKQIVDDKRFVADPRQREEALAACREAKAVFLKHLPNAAQGGTTDAENEARQQAKDGSGESRRGRQRKAA